MRRPYILGAAAFVASLAIFLAVAHAYGCTRIGGLLSQHVLREGGRRPGPQTRRWIPGPRRIVIAPLLVLGTAVSWKRRATPRSALLVPGLLPERWVVLLELVDR